MKSIVALNYFNKIKALLKEDEFHEIETIISNEQNERLEVFWNIIVAGYSIEFALTNYILLYEYVKDKPIDYPESLVTYITYPGLKTEIYIDKTKWYELN